jgi:heparinase II/III-like protein
MAAYRLEDLTRDMMRAFSLPPAEAVRRLSGRAVRYARRVRNRRRIPRLADADLLGALSAPASSLAELAARRRESAPLAPGSRRCAEVAEILRKAAPETLEPILHSAREIAEGRFDLLGSGPIQLGAAPDWHSDFKSGKRWPPEAHSLEIPTTPDRGSDIKVPWELARLQHLPMMGIASAASGDPRFRERASAHVASFLEGNPVGRGVNWRCTMDVALRASEILAGEGFLDEIWDDRFRAELLKSLLLHARFIRENLEDGPVLGNHYLSDLAGLYLCGHGLREFREARIWREFSRERLLAEMRRQVGADHLDYEASLSYHPFVTEMFLFPALLATGSESPFPDTYLRTLEGMLHAVAVLIRPDGTLPQIGDNDDGRFLIFSQYHRPRRDWRPLLALGSFLFRKEDWLSLAGDAWVEGAWVLGEPFLRWKRSVPQPPGFRGFQSRAFPTAGIYQLGSGDVQMVVDAGGVGQGGNGGHAHNDTLSFDLYAFGSEVLPDRGTGVYTPDLAVRDRFRSTAAHNTLQVDCEEINPFPGEPFRLPPIDSPRATRWRCRDRYAYLSAEHSGFRRLREGVTHRRRILLDRERGTFRIEDRILGKGRHRFRASFHLAPGWDAEIEPLGWRAWQGREGPVLNVAWSRLPPGTRVGIEEDRHSPSYGVLRPAGVVRVEWEGEAPCSLRYALSWRERNSR